MESVALDSALSFLSEGLNSLFRVRKKVLHLGCSSVVLKNGGEGEREKSNKALALHELLITLAGKLPLCR